MISPLKDAAMKIPTVWVKFVFGDGKNYAKLDNEWKINQKKHCLEIYTQH